MTMERDGAALHTLARVNAACNQRDSESSPRAPNTRGDCEGRLRSCASARQALRLHAEGR
jgi:hypothetical protein